MVNLLIETAEPASFHNSGALSAADGSLPNLAGLQLQQASLRRLHAFDRGSGEVGEERPAKRPRISDKDSNASKTEHVPSLLEILSRLLGAKEPQTLASIPGIAR